jgi:hypothetical protein
LYGYTRPSGSVVAVCHARKPQPCLAVSTADVAPSALKDATHADTLRFVGAKDAGLEELHPPPASHAFQLDDVQPGSPS